MFKLKVSHGLSVPLKVSYICSICRSYNSFVTQILRNGYPSQGIHRKTFKWWLQLNH